MIHYLVIRSAVHNSNYIGERETHTIKSKTRRSRGGKTRFIINSSIAERSNERQREREGEATLREQADQAGEEQRKKWRESSYGALDWAWLRVIIPTVRLRTSL